MTANSEQGHPPAKPARILLVDDHPLVRQGLVDLLGGETGLQICGQAESRKEALQIMETSQTDLAIVDLSLKNSHGLELIKDIRARFPKVRVLVVTVHDELEQVEQTLRAGASGYITKEDATINVVQAVRQVLRGELVLSPKIATHMAARLAGHPSGGNPTKQGKLSGRELEILGLIGDGLGRQEIAERLHLDVNTVETYRVRIKEKLQLKDAQELLQYAIRAKRSRNAAV